MEKNKRLILGIETSCDETGLAVVEKRKNQPPKILVNLIYSQVQIHSQTKGIVPEIAAREQNAKIFPLLKQLSQKVELKRIDLVAVTNRPGLVGSLLVGINLAKTLGYSLAKPLVKINHLIAHLYSFYLNNREPKFPLLGLIVSGGHTSLILLKDHNQAKILGQTRDDAAGEAFDKTANLLNLSYPGGPAIEKAAQGIKKKNGRFSLPRPLLGKGLDFSFSGLKTAVLREVKRGPLNQREISQLAWEFQEATSDVLIEKLSRAVRETKAKEAVLGGGVVANKRLREKIRQTPFPIPVNIPSINLSTDNGAMVAARASYLKKRIDWTKLEVEPTL